MWIPITQETGSVTPEVFWSVFPGDKPPSSPSAFDDEFSGGSLDPKWAWRNQGASTATVGNSVLNLAAAPGSGDQCRVLEQTIGVASWTVTSKVVSILNRDANNKIGIAAINDTSGRMITAEGTFETAGSVLRFSRWTSVSAYSASLASINVFPTGWIYYRLVCNGTTIVPYVSNDGVVWNTLGNGASEALASFISSVDRIGLFVNNANTANLMSGSFHWFRVTTP